MWDLMVTKADLPERLLQLASRSDGATFALLSEAAEALARMSAPAVELPNPPATPATVETAKAHINDRADMLVDIQVMAMDAVASLEQRAELAEAALGDAQGT
ncbi:hypothetical protein BIWAKO_07047 [Bosea sp. BIWAKO-01]|nr:hypothetical protein BIWAKO_07047 [Bosea sp. BIWAKO-01]